MATRNRILAIVLLFITSMCFTVKAQELLQQFDPTHFSGWTYNNAGGIELNQTNIARNRITLLTTEQGNVTELISPAVNCVRADMLQVEVLYVAFSTDYLADRLTLNIEATDANGTSLSQTTVTAKAGMLEQTLTAVINVSRDMKPVLRFTAPRADKDNCAAVKRIRIYGLQKADGDLNSDGKIDVTDVSLLIDVVLGKTVTLPEGAVTDLNTDKKTDVTDVSLLIDIILGKS